MNVTVTSAGKDLGLWKDLGLYGAWKEKICHHFFIVVLEIGWATPMDSILQIE
jgi:hypothetical protein